VHAIYILVSGFDQRVLHSAKQFTDAKNILVAKNSASQSTPKSLSITSANCILKLGYY